MNTRTRLVLIENHAATRQGRLGILRRAGYRVRGYACVEDFDDEPNIEPVDIFILSLNLPCEEGFSLCERLRASSARMGLVVLSELVQPDQLGRVYRSGVDVYLSKPVHAATLLPALERLTQRVGKHYLYKVILLAVNERHGYLQGPMSQTRLSLTECNVLIAFARTVDQRLPNWRIVEVAGLDESRDTKSLLEGRMSRLRRKLRDAGYPAQCLYAEYGSGYRLTLPVALV